MVGNSKRKKQETQSYKNLQKSIDKNGGKIKEKR